MLLSNERINVRALWGCNTHPSVGVELQENTVAKKANQINEPVIQNENLILIQRIRNRFKNELRCHYAPLCHKVDIEILHNI